MSPRIGALLNRRWNIGARHALYHKDGTWYHQLTRFPGALCDPYGYVLFKNEDEFHNCPKLRIDQDVNINGHISDVLGYVRVQESQYFLPKY
jgi:5-methylcytosine-specific restriction enzyme A